MTPTCTETSKCPRHRARFRGDCGWLSIDDIALLRAIGPARPGEPIVALTEQLLDRERELVEARAQADAAERFVKEWEKLRHGAYKLYREAGDERDALRAEAELAGKG